MLEETFVVIVAKDGHISYHVVSATSDKKAAMLTKQYEAMFVGRKMAYHEFTYKVVRSETSSPLTAKAMVAMVALKEKLR